jgi:hypothetical protein
MRKLAFIVLLLLVSIPASAQRFPDLPFLRSGRLADLAPVPSVGLKTLSRSFALGAANTPVNLNTALLALSPAPGFPLTFSEMIIINDPSDNGNLGLSDDSSVSAESSTALLYPGDSVRQQMATVNDPINPNDYYLISATLNKKVQILARSSR